MRAILVAALIWAGACSGDADLERRVALLEARLAADGQWWCVGAACKRMQAECEALRGSSGTSLRCERRRVAFCIQAGMCFSSLAECHRFAVGAAGRVEACAGVE